jgi:hypothetical protein
VGRESQPPSQRKEGGQGLASLKHLAFQTGRESSTLDFVSDFSGKFDLDWVKREEEKSSIVFDLDFHPFV